MARQMSLVSSLCASMLVRSYGRLNSQHWTAAADCFVYGSWWIFGHSIPGVHLHFASVAGNGCVCVCRGVCAGSVGLNMPIFDPTPGKHNASGNPFMANGNATAALVQECIWLFFGFFFGISLVLDLEPYLWHTRLWTFFKICCTSSRRVLHNSTFSLLSKISKVSKFTLYSVVTNNSLTLLIASQSNCVTSFP